VKLRCSGQSARSDDSSSDNDREGIREVPGQSPQICVVPGPGHHINGTNDSHRAVNEAQRHGGRHFSVPGDESDDEANEQEGDEVSDVNARRCEEHIGAEVMLGNLVSLKQDVGQFSSFVANTIFVRKPLPIRTRGARILQAGHPRLTPHCR
jgi:hypothetical protein